jgi:hypothetical protein
LDGTNSGWYFGENANTASLCQEFVKNVNSKRGGGVSLNLPRCNGHFSSEDNVASRIVPIFSKRKTHKTSTKEFKLAAILLIDTSARLDSYSYSRDEEKIVFKTTIFPRFWWIPTTDATLHGIVVVWWGNLVHFL